MLDDSTWTNPIRQTELVAWHWSGKHHRAVKGINLLTLLWTDGDLRYIPCDYRLYDKVHGGFSKNDLFGQLLRQAKQRGLQQPKCVCFDSWYSGLDNLKLLRSLGWTWLGRLKSNLQGAGRLQVATERIQRGDGYSSGWPGSFICHTKLWVEFACSG